ncbi:hypothetical protein ACMFMG_006214 [Clarireedia jacksonii]
MASAIQMSRHHDFAYTTQHEPSSPKTATPKSSTNNKFFKRVRRAARTSSSRLSVSYTESDPPKENVSKNNHVPCVETAKRPQQMRRSLSAMSNNSSGIFDGYSENECVSDLDSEVEEVSWNIIAREIQEWNYVCQTGRPFWWSTEAKSSRLRTLSTTKPGEASKIFQIKNAGDKSTSCQITPLRRAISESNLPTSSWVTDELVQMIAVQLLGACFTLPPEYLVPLTPALSSYNGKGGSKLPNSCMISALRMHTQFRYSPCFGHQARNASPIQPWDGVYDGSSVYSASPPDTSGTKTPVIETLGPTRRRNRLQKALKVLHVTETSIDSHHSESHDDPKVTRAGDNDNIDTSKVYRGVQSSQLSKTKYRLQPVLRSEPHPVFVQPVRELVVKRWRSLRRQLGGSLHSAVPASPSEELGADLVAVATRPTMSSDIRSRRQKAQERGEIHSGSMESTPRYNTPVTGSITPAASEHLSYLHALGPESSERLREDSDQNLNDLDQIHQIIRPPDPELFTETGAYISPNMTMTKSDAGFFFIHSESDMQFEVPTFVAKGTPRRQRVTGMLSELHIPVDDDIPKGHQLTVHQNSSSGATATICGVSADESSHRDRRRKEGSENGSDLPPNANDSPKEAYHSTMVRTSTNETQIFRPGSDGIELDGLPVGPGEEFWDGSVDKKGKRKERTYL